MPKGLRIYNIGASDYDVIGIAWQQWQHLSFDNKSCPPMNTFRLYIFHNLQIGIGQMRDDLQKFLDTIVDCDCYGLMSKLLDLSI